ncbi:MAG: diaminopimelate decarboxylase [Acidimicrobiia bacterium]
MTAVEASPIDLTLLPVGIGLNAGRMHLHGIDLGTLAEQFGTPLFVYDEDEIRARARLLVEGFAPGTVAYAGKAFLAGAMARLISETDLHLDVASGPELEIAVHAGVDPGRIHMHGNAKSEDEIRAALQHRIGHIVADSDSEIDVIARLSRELGVTAPVMLRVTPGVSGETHPSIDTGTASSKFGLDIASGAAARAVARLSDEPSIDWRGIHAHIGSQVRSIAAFHESAFTVISFAAELAARGHAVREINVGGGFAVRYHGDDVAPTLSTFIPALRAEVDAMMQSAGLPPETAITIEPGRALVAPAALTLYRVLSTKTSGSGIRYVAVDGGMSDNPRPALYGARYEAFLPERAAEARTETVAIAGKHCEQGDVLIPKGHLPPGAREGDLLATPVTGAYGYSMSSNYNAALRAAVVFISSRGVRLVRRRETVADLEALDVVEAPHALGS